MAQVAVNQAQLNRVLKRLRGFGVSINGPLEKGIEFVGEAVVNHAKRKHFFVGTGVGSSARAQAGEIRFKNPDGSLRFKIRTNNLVRSIKAESVRTLRGKVQMEVTAGTGIEYAKRVEEGGPGTRPFPFMKPAVEAIRPKAIKIIKATVLEHIRRFGGSR